MASSHANTAIKRKTRLTQAHNYTVSHYGFFTLLP